MLYSEKTKRSKKVFVFSPKGESDKLKLSDQKEGINVVPEIDVSQACNALVSRLEAAREYRMTLEARLEKAERKIMKAEAYQQIMNLMSAHVHCCLNQDYAEELERYWSKRDDIVYANGDLAYVGQAAVRKYYVEAAKKRSETARQQLKAAGKSVPEGDKIPGYKNMNLIGTPYIEIAEDGKTAQGIWMAHSFMGCADASGNLKTQGLLSRYSGEFILEEGQWKIWHRRNYADVVFEENPMGMMGPPPTKDGKPPKPMVENPKQTVITKIKVAGGGYSAASVPSGEPKLPEPYDTWTYETSNVQKEDVIK